MKVTYKGYEFDINGYINEAGLEYFYKMAKEEEEKKKLKKKGQKMMIDEITKLIEKELKEANNKFPEFQSRHESYAVLKEELEEAQKELDDIACGILRDYWEHCCNKKYNSYNNNDTNILLQHIGIAVNCAITELIQVGAMVKKAKRLEKTGGV